MQDTGEKQVLVKRGSLIVVTVIIAALLLGMVYLFGQRYGITSPNVVWTLVLAGLMFATSYVQYRDKPLVRESEKPGLLPLKVLTLGVVIFFLTSRTHELFDVIMAEIWPLLLGAVLALFVSLLHSVFYRSSG